MKQSSYTRQLITVLFGILVFPMQAQEKQEKGVIKIDLTYHQLNNDLPVLKISTKTKKGKKFQSVEGVEVNLFFKEETSQGFMGKAKSNYYGVGSLQLPQRFRNSFDSSSSLLFIATLTGNERFEDQSTEIEITKARIELVVEEKDSVKTMRTKVFAFQDSGWVVTPETEVKLVVRRLLSDLSATEEEFYTTDENGEAVAEFNLSIPGDMNGNIIIGSKIVEHELFGSLTTTTVIPWGLPLVHDNSFAERTLWATRDKTPLWLLIFPNLIIVSVWGVIFYLIYLIGRIIKLGKTSEHT